MGGTVGKIQINQARFCLCSELGAGVSLQTLLDVPMVYTPPEDPWMQSVMAHCQPLFSEPLQPKTVS